ncbi:MAG: two-component sensor histidine kinase, partial [Paucibacter sp.]|nr:two-component sensor histidine kinase [Roseateles sp.]
ELRSPLTALKLQLDLAERANGEGDRQQAFRKLHERLDRATHLVRQLMTLARQEQSDASPARTACDLVRIAHQVVSDHLIYADSRQIELNFTTTLTALPLMAHAEGLGVMLNNLFDNALRYTQAGGRVDVLVRTERGCPSVVVADNGPGVPKEGRERLFDRFYRPEGNKVWGSGLGLSIVKSVADAHHASLRLDTNGHSGLMVTAVFPIS